MAAGKKTDDQRPSWMDQPRNKSGRFARSPEDSVTMEMVRGVIEVWEKNPDEEPATRGYVKRIARKVIKNSTHCHIESGDLIIVLGWMTALTTILFTAFSLHSEGYVFAIDVSVALMSAIVALSCVLARIAEGRTDCATLVTPESVKKFKLRDEL
jgi:hypothetical protein